MTSENQSVEDLLLGWWVILGILLMGGGGVAFNCKHLYNNEFEDFSLLTSIFPSYSTTIGHLTPLSMSFWTSTKRFKEVPRDQ